MKTRVIAVCLVLAAAHGASAQNLLTNGDFEATPANVYYDGFDPNVADDVPGWLISLGAADGSYVLVSLDGSAGTWDVDTANGAAGGGIETALGSRPAVTPGNSYRAALTYDNYFGATAAAYFIDWFDAGGALLSSTGGELGDPNGPLTYAPYAQLLSTVGVAPAGAASAGVRFASGNPGYNGLAADNFALTLIPEPSGLALAACGGALLAARRQQRHTH